MKDTLNEANYLRKELLSNILELYQVFLLAYRNDSLILSWIVFRRFQNPLLVVILEYKNPFVFLGTVYTV